MATNFNTYDWSETAGASGVFFTDDASAAATLCEVLSAPPAGTVMQLAVASRVTGEVVFSFTVGPTDNPDSIAVYFATVIARSAQQPQQAGVTLGGGNISSEYTPDSDTFGVTNQTGNLASVTPLNCAANWKILPGGSNLDAVSFALVRLPAGNIVPPAGSNVCQIMFCSSQSNDPGVSCVQYAVVAGNIICSTSGDLIGELEILTPLNGTSALAKVAAFSRGFYIGTATDKGAGSCNAESYFLNGTPLVIRPDGSLGLKQ